MKRLLEDRAFLVEEVSLGSQEDVDATSFDGLVLGIPVPGLGLRGGGVSPSMRRFVESLGDLEEVRVAMFSVYTVRSGDTLELFRALLEERGAEVVAAQALSRLVPARNEHVLPTECMVRIR